MTRYSLLLVIVVTSSVGCVRARQHDGVKNKWRDADVANFERGKTTRSQVLKALGPPSQVIDLEDQIVFYYLLEETKVGGVALIVYNNIRVHSDYDRAIFFFGKDGILSDFAYSDERVTLPEKDE